MTNSWYFFGNWGLCVFRSVERGVIAHRQLERWFGEYGFEKSKFVFISGYRE